MFHAMAQLLTIGRNTFIESIRQPIFTVLMLVATILLVLNVSISMYSMGNDNKLLVDMGLSTLFISGLLLAAFTATGVLSQEIENKTVLTIVSKPVARPIFVLGKYLGVTAALFLAFWAMTAIFLLTVRHGVVQTASDTADYVVILFGVGGLVLALLGSAMANYFYHWVFTSTIMISMAVTETLALIIIAFINKKWQFQAFNLGDTQLLLGIILILMGLLMVTAVAITASTRLGQIMTLVICTAMFMLGLSADFMFQYVKDGSRIWIWLYRIIPNIQVFWAADSITQKQQITSSYMLLAGAYALLFVIAFLSLAVALFQTREVG